MGYYDALIAKWPSLSGTTQQKVDALNAMLVTGVTPSKFTVKGSDIYNAIVPSEWNTIAATTQQLVRDIFSLGDNITAGSGTNVNSVLLAAFNGKAATLANLAALVPIPVTPWWQSVGYKYPVDLGLVQSLGLN